MGFLIFPTLMLKLQLLVNNTQITHLRRVWANNAHLFSGTKQMKNYFHHHVQCCQLEAWASMSMKQCSLCIRKTETPCWETKLETLARNNHTGLKSHDKAHQSTSLIRQEIPSGGNCLKKACCVGFTTRVYTRMKIWRTVTLAVYCLLCTNIQCIGCFSLIYTFPHDSHVRQLHHSSSNKK